MFSLIKFLIKTIIIVVIGYFIFTSSTVKSILTEKGDIAPTNTITQNTPDQLLPQAKESLPKATNSIKETSGNLLTSLKDFLLGENNFELPKLDNIVQSQLGGLPNLNKETNLVNQENVNTNTDRIYFDATVHIVIDGDTIAVKSLENGEITRIRLKGINTPETSGPYTQAQCMGKESAIELRRLLQNKKVTVISDSLTPTHDAYGRLLAYIYTEDEILVNEEMILNGYAYEYTYKDEKYEMQNLFKEREQQAKSNERGLWDKAKCAPKPIGA